MRCKKMPVKLRDWDAYKHLSDRTKAFETVMPLLTELSKESIKMRHWGEVMKVTGTRFNVDGAELKLEALLSAGLDKYAEDIEEVSKAADKQLGVENKLHEIPRPLGAGDVQLLRVEGPPRADPHRGARHHGGARGTLARRRSWPATPSSLP